MKYVRFYFQLGKQNKDLKPLVDAVSKMEAAGKPMEFKMNLQISRLYPPETSRRFARYLGSLTTPTCDERVVWTVFMNPVEIAPSQVWQKYKSILMNFCWCSLIRLWVLILILWFSIFKLKEFWDIRDKEGMSALNFRPLQKLNKRTISYFETGKFEELKALWSWFSPCYTI